MSSPEENSGTGFAAGRKPFTRGISASANSSNSTVIGIQFGMQLTPTPGSAGSQSSALFYDAETVLNSYVSIA